MRKGCTCPTWSRRVELSAQETTWEHQGRGWSWFPGSRPFPLSQCERWPWSSLWPTQICCPCWAVRTQGASRSQQCPEDACLSRPGCPAPWSTKQLKILLSFLKSEKNTSTLSFKTSVSDQSERSRKRLNPVARRDGHETQLTQPAPGFQTDFNSSICSSFNYNRTKRTY